jgi:hypothetical protein
VPPRPARQAEALQVVDLCPNEPVRFASFPGLFARNGERKRGTAAEVLKTTASESLLRIAQQFCGPASVRRDQRDQAGRGHAVRDFVRRTVA